MLEVACFHSSGLKSLSWNWDGREDFCGTDCLRWKEEEAGKGKSEVPPPNPFIWFRVLCAVRGRRLELRELVKKPLWDFEYKQSCSRIPGGKCGWSMAETSLKSGSCGSRPYTTDQDSGDLRGWGAISLQPYEEQMSWSWSLSERRRKVCLSSKVLAWFGQDSLYLRANVLHGLKWHERPLRSIKLCFQMLWGELCP